MRGFQSSNSNSNWVPQGFSSGPNTMQQKFTANQSAQFGKWDGGFKSSNQQGKNAFGDFGNFAFGSANKNPNAAPTNNNMWNSSAPTNNAPQQQPGQGGQNIWSTFGQGSNPSQNPTAPSNVETNTAAQDNNNQEANKPGQEEDDLLDMGVGKKKEESKITQKE